MLRGKNSSKGVRRVFEGRTGGIWYKNVSTRCQPAWINSEYCPQSEQFKTCNPGGYWTLYPVKVSHINLPQHTTYPGDCEAVPPKLVSSVVVWLSHGLRSHNEPVFAMPWWISHTRTEDTSFSGVQAFYFYYSPSLEPATQTAQNLVGR